MFTNFLKQSFMIARTKEEWENTTEKKYQFTKTVIEWIWLMLFCTYPIFQLLSKGKIFLGFFVIFVVFLYAIVYGRWNTVFVKEHFLKTGEPIHEMPFRLQWFNSLSVGIALSGFSLESMMKVLHQSSLVAGIYLLQIAVLGSLFVCCFLLLFGKRGAGTS